MLVKIGNLTPRLPVTHYGGSHLVSFGKTIKGKLMKTISPISEKTFTSLALASNLKLKFSSHPFLTNFEKIANPHYTCPKSAFSTSDRRCSETGIEIRSESRKIPAGSLV